MAIYSGKTKDALDGVQENRDSKSMLNRILEDIKGDDSE